MLTSQVFQWVSCKGLKASFIMIVWMLSTLHPGKTFICEKRESRSSCVTYKFDVVLLIQQEVFYLQIPVRQRAGKRVNIFTVFVFTLDNVSNRQQSYNANAGEARHIHKHPSQCGSRWLIFQGLLFALRSLLSLRNPVIQLSTQAISLWLKFSSQALCDKELNVPGKSVVKFICGTSWCSLCVSS